MDSEPIRSKYLFKTHSRQKIRVWVSQLEYACFKWAHGGWASDGDEFKLSMSYRNKDELLEIVNKLGIKLELIPPDYPKPIPNKKYSFQEYKKFKSEIKDFPEYEQPFYININNIPVSCWIENGEIDFKFSGAKDGNLYEVTELDFVNCRNFEDLIKK